MTIPRALVAVLLTCLFAGLLSAVQVPASAHLDNCVLRANAPHLGAGGTGIDAKSTMNCTHGHDKIEINPALWKCDRSPGDGVHPSENWIFDNCDPVEWAFHSWTNTVANTKYTGMVPEPGAPEIHGRGWYVNDTVFATHNNGNLRAIGKTSTVEFLDG